MKTFKDFLQDKFNTIHLDLEEIDESQVYLEEGKSPYLGYSDVNLRTDTYDHKEEMKKDGLKLHKLHNITDKEKASLRHYSGSGYEYINNYNRKNEKLPHKDHYNYVHKKARKDRDMGHTKNIDSVIDKHNTEHPVHVWRGIHTALTDKLKKGGVYTDRGFVSTSLSKSTAYAFSGTSSDKGRHVSHIAHIKVPKGSKAFFMEHTVKGMKELTHTEHQGENEVLLPRKSKLRYDGHTEHHDGYLGSTIRVHHFTHIPKAPKTS